MNGLFVVLLAAAVIGAVICGKKKLKIPMVGCIIVAIVSLFLLICAAWLMWTID